MSGLNIITIHGWALSPEFWSPLQHALASSLARHDVTFTHVDCGFFAPENKTGSKPQTVAIMPNANHVVITHSLGTLWFQHHRNLFPKSLQAVVCLAGFPCFAATPEFTQGVPPRVLDRMMTKFQQDPHAVLNDFLQRAAGPKLHERPEFALLQANLQPINLPKLTEGLQWLQRLNYSQQFLDRTEPLLSLSARDDAIAPSELSRGLRAANSASVQAQSQHVATEFSGHLFPFFFPDACAKLIVGFLEELS